MGPQRIGYFGPNGGGIATLPQRPVDPGLVNSVIGAQARAADPTMHPGPTVPIPSMVDQVPANPGGDILTALAALHGGRLGSPQPSLHNLLAAAAAAHPRPRAQVGRGLTEPTQLYHNPQTHLYPQLHANSGGAGY